MPQQPSLYPLEFFIEAVPVSLGAGSRSKDRWKANIGQIALHRRQAPDEAGFLDDRPVAATIYYFPAAAMAGDIDNIVKPILDALNGIAYLDDRQVERVVVQKFEPEIDWTFSDPSDQLAEALDRSPPIVYIRVDDDLSWRQFR